MYVYEHNFFINNPQGLIYHKTPTNQTNKQKKAKILFFGREDKRN